MWPIGENPPVVINEKIKKPEWATLIPSRSPEFKMHTSLGLAKSALTGLTMYGGQFRDRGALYQWNGTFWELRVAIKRGDKQTDFLLWTNVKKFKQQDVGFVIEEVPS